MSGHWDSIDNSTYIASNNTDRNKKVNMSVDKLDENTKEVMETFSEEVLQNNTQVDNVVDELININNTNTTSHSTNIVGNTTEFLNYDSEDDMLLKTRVKKKKYIAIADSDSEEENLPLATPLTDSDNEDISEQIKEDSKKKKHRRLAVVDSDSDIDNEVILPHNKSYSDEGSNLGLKSKQQVIFTTNSKGELVPETSNENFTVQKSKLSALYDPESSDEEVCKENIAKEYNSDEEEIKPKPYKKKSKPKKDEEENPKKMTGKEAAELRREIKSASQRRVREKDVALPYHKPKSHTLKEFLARRSKFISAIPLSAKTPASVAIKMSTEQLEIITKKLKEREKEVKEFYKSESESEDDDGDEDYIPPTQDKEESQENDEHDSKTKNTDPMISVSDEIEDDGDKDFIAPTHDKEQSQKNNDYGSKTKNIGTVEHDSGEIKDDNDKDYIPSNQDKEKSQESNDHDSKTKNTDPMITVSEEIKDDGDTDFIPPIQDKEQAQEDNDYDSKTNNMDTMVPVSGEIKDGSDRHYILSIQDKEKTQENNDCHSKTKNINSTVTVSDEIKDNGQDSGIDMQEISDKLRDVSDEGDLIKTVSMEKNSIVEEKVTNQIFDEVTISEKTNVESESLICSEDDMNSLNISDNLNDKSADISKETEGEFNGCETAAENNTMLQLPKSVLNTEDSATGYEFNLDDLEENSERVFTEKYASDTNDVLEKQENRFQYTDVDREIENFCATDDKTNESPIIIPKLSKLELIKERLANIKPKLSGGPDQVIDLETGIAKPNDITRLMERFAQHNLKKHMHKNKVKLSIVSVESGEIHKEIVAVNVEDEDDLLEIEEKPGARLQKLRNELQSQIALKRSEFWQNKNKKEVTDMEENMYKGEKEECDMDDDILDDEEEEADMTEISEDEENDDIQENRKVKKKKSDFIDEEAEESDRDDEAMEADDEDDVDEDIEPEDFPKSDLIEDENSKSSNISEKIEKKPVKKSLRRIVKGFEEDSDDDDDRNIGLVTKTASTSEIEKKDFSNIVSQDDYFLPPHQPQSSQSPVKHTITQEKSQLDFATPISYITGLQNLNNSASKSTKVSPVTSLFHTTNLPSPLKENNWQHNLQKKLFMDTDITDSQLEGIAEMCPEESPNTQEINDASTVNKEELVKICSGTFPSSLPDKGNETQLAELCSGTFHSPLEAEKQDLSSEKLPSTQDLLNICSGKFTGATQNDCNEEPQTGSRCTAETYTFSTNNEIKSLDAVQDMIISQLIDEEEMENFKKKFDSPLLSNTQRRIVEEFEEVVGSGGVIDSDEDEILEVKKKKQKKLVFSDDENSDEDEKEDEVIDLHDDVGSENNDASNDVPADNIGYDSEENEIELVDESDNPADNIDYDSEENEIEFTEERAGPKLKPSDFFENEAELSESDWGSADEDERDLDTMEFEQGDAENFDKEKIRSDLERIHMRKLLDDDTREVKMLQELLLEDGELHGTGRERQFKWKNIDLINDENEERKDDGDDVYLDEEESEEQWRKKRYEREMFLKEKQDKVKHSEDDDLLSESQLLKIGHKVLQRSQIHSQGNNTSVDKTKVTPGSPDIKKPFSILNQRGSFLSRSDHVLQRLAEYNKITSVTQGSAKNSRKFVFQTVSLEETSTSVIQDKKRKATDGTPKVLKKLRLSDNLSPVVSKKNPDKTAKGKLFGNW